MEAQIYDILEALVFDHFLKNFSDLKGFHVSMRWCLFVIALTISCSLRAQTPVIDHLSIDDPTGTLTIVGSFGSGSGTVFIDSVPASTKSWTSDTIICIIPDSGRGSCGPVLVVNSVGRSNERLLTEWSLWGASGYSGDNNGRMYLTEKTVFFNFRLDLLSILQRNNSRVVLLNSMNTSYQRRVDSAVGNGPSSGSVTFINGSLSFTSDLKHRLIVLDAGYSVPLNSGHWQFQFDSGFSMSPFQEPYHGINNWGNITGALEPPAFLPPDSLIRAAEKADVSESIGKTEFSISVQGSHIVTTFDGSPSERTFSIFDDLGRTITTQSILPESTKNDFHQPLTPGMYFAMLGSQVVKFIVFE